MYAYFTVEQHWSVHKTNRLFHDAQALMCGLISSGSTEGPLVPRAYVFCWERLLVSCHTVLVRRTDAGQSRYIGKRLLLSFLV